MTRPLWRASVYSTHCHAQTPGQRIGERSELHGWGGPGGVKGNASCEQGMLLEVHVHSSYTLMCELAANAMWLLDVAEHLAASNMHAAPALHYLHRSPVIIPIGSSHSLTWKHSASSSCVCASATGSCSGSTAGSLHLPASSGVAVAVAVATAAGDRCEPQAPAQRRDRFSPRRLLRQRWGRTLSTWGERGRGGEREGGDRHGWGGRRGEEVDET